MVINLIELINNKKNKITIDSDINISDEYLQNTDIRKVDNLHFTGYIEKLVDDTFELFGNITGTMVLPDNITLEDFAYTFNSEISDNFEENALNLQKSIDITEILWQNILVEVPLRTVNSKNENIKLSGDGWRLISEEDIKTENNPLSDLKDLLGKE